MNNYWIRAAVAALLFEIALVVVSVPFYALAGMEAFVPYAAPVVFCVGIPFGYWAACRTGSVAQGLVVGLVATLIYLALVLAQSGSLTPVADMYGRVNFVLVNVLKVLGCVAGSWLAAHRRGARSR